ncbi:MAG TPA: DUF3592 domain-containing protein [Allosphingosinicella sp.]
MAIVGLAFMLLGSVFFFAFRSAHRRARKKANASAAWPSTLANVISSQVEEMRTTEGSSYRPVVVYRYSAAGSEYEGQRIRFGNLYGSERSARAVADRYPSGSEQAVRYNPEKPEDAVLETKLPGPTYLILAIGGLLFAGVGLAMVMIA